MTACAAVLLSAACGTTTDDEPRAATPPSSTDTSADLVITRDVDVAGVTDADVFAPVNADGVPVVVLFHGTEGRRSNMEPLAAELARSGSVVFLPSWPVITERPAFESTEDIFFEQTATAVCAVRFARASAAEHGGDPSSVTVVGHSGGAPLGARVALVEEPPWPGIDCYPGVSSHVDRFVGTGGDYFNEYQSGTWIPDVYRPYDVFELEPTNRSLEVRLVHGGADTTVDVGNSTLFDRHLDAAGIDSDVVYVDATHGELRDPSTPGGRLVAEQIDALVHERTSVFDEPGSSATLRFDGTDCSFRGPAAVRLGTPLRIRLTTTGEGPAWFALVGLAADLTDAELAAIVTAAPRPLEETVAYTDPASFVLVEPGSDGEMTWVIVADTHRWVAYCMPIGASGQPDSGNMSPAAEVRLAQ